jgi:hypothetical protein
MQQHFIRFEELEGLFLDDARSAVQAFLRGSELDAIHVGGNCRKD